jgi:hypothetical protein
MNKKRLALAFALALLALSILYLTLPVKGDTIQADIHITSPIQNQTYQTKEPEPTPSVPELSWLAVLPLILFVFSFVVTLSHRKTSSKPVKKEIQILIIGMSQ